MPTIRVREWHRTEDSARQVPGTCFIRTATQNLLGKLEDVKDELFHLDPVWLVRLDEPALGVHVGDLLLSHVVPQPRLVHTVQDRRQCCENAQRRTLATTLRGQGSATRPEAAT